MNAINPQKQTIPLQGILLIGPTGAGKTPLGQALEHHGFRGQQCCHFDFGEQLRLADQHPDRYPFLQPDDLTVIHNALHEGALLTDAQFHIAAGIFRSFIADNESVNYIIMNGLPRHLGQADDVAAFIKIAHIINLTCTPETVRNRIRSNSGGDRAERKDDSQAEVKNKLQLFTERTEPLLQCYQDKGVEVIPITVQTKTSPSEIIDQIPKARQ